MDEMQKSKTLKPSGGSKRMSVSNEDVMNKLTEFHRDALKALATSEQNQISLKEITRQLNNGGIKDTLARIDERTKFIKESSEKQDERLTHLERRDWYVTAFSMVTSGLATFFGVKN